MAGKKVRNNPHPHWQRSHNSYRDLHPSALRGRTSRGYDKKFDKPKTSKNLKSKIRIPRRGKKLKQPKTNSGSGRVSHHTSRSTSLHMGSQEWRSWFVIGFMLLVGLFIVAWLLPMVVVEGLSMGFDRLFQNIGDFFGGIVQNVGDWWNTIVMNNSGYPSVPNAPPTYDIARYWSGVGEWLQDVTTDFENWLRSWFM